MKLYALVKKHPRLAVLLGFILFSPFLVVDQYGENPGINFVNQLLGFVDDLPTGKIFFVVASGFLILLYPRLRGYLEKDKPPIIIYKEDLEDVDEDVSGLESAIRLDTISKVSVNTPLEMKTNRQRESIDQQEWNISKISKMSDSEYYRFVTRIKKDPTMSELEKQRLLNRFNQHREDFKRRYPNWH